MWKSRHLCHNHKNTERYTSMYNNLPACTTKPLFFTTWYRFKIDAPLWYHSLQDSQHTTSSHVSGIWQEQNNSIPYQREVHLFWLIASGVWKESFPSPKLLSRCSLIFVWSNMMVVDHLLEKHGMHRPLQSFVSCCCLMFGTSTIRWGSTHSPWF